ncbi:MAG: methyltransferase domain-containing protein [Sulfurovaceae bacterium]|nr:methyltransferase domain-containing protein [Sulfurovaceae bacterium]
MKKTKQTSWDPNKYNVNSKGQAIWAKELIDKIGIEGYESILDIGCGDGKITEDLAQITTGEVVGIDFDQNMVDFAKEIYKKPTFIQMDAQNINFENRFDIVFSNAALHWVQDHKAVVNGIYKALKRNGKAILQMGGEGNAKDVFEALEKITPNYAKYLQGYKSPYRFCSDIYYNDLLGQVGFSKYNAKLIQKDMVHDDVTAFKGWLETTWFPFIDRIPKSLKETFLKEWIDTYLDYFPQDENGKIHIAMIRLEVEAVK